MATGRQATKYSCGGGRVYRASTGRAAGWLAGKCICVSRPRRRSFVRSLDRPRQTGRRTVTRSCGAAASQRRQAHEGRTARMETNGQTDGQSAVITQIKVVYVLETLAHHTAAVQFACFVGPRKICPTVGLCTRLQKPACSKLGELEKFRPSVGPVFCAIGSLPLTACANRKASFGRLAVPLAGTARRNSRQSVCRSLAGLPTSKSSVNSQRRRPSARSLVRSSGHSVVSLCGWLLPLPLLLLLLLLCVYVCVYSHGKLGIPFGGGISWTYNSILTIINLSYSIQTTN